MGHPGFNRQWARTDEPGRRQRRAVAAAARGATSAAGTAPAARSGPAAVGGRPVRPRLEHEQRRGPRVRRGDVRSAILDVLRAAEESGEQVNGYQVIQQISERSEGAWRPSPGSVYPTIQQLAGRGAGRDRRRARPQDAAR